MHQVNLEYLARVVFDGVSADGKPTAYPDSLVGTDSHTTMINGLGVLGWGVGGIEAEAAMLGQPLSMLIPDVVGFKLHGRLAEGATATDLVLTVTEMLRKKGVVGKFVEFFGTGLSSLSLPDRATLANMAPEYGATMGFFPVDAETLAYLRFTGRNAERIALVEAYTKQQGIFRTDQTPDPIYSDTLELDLATVEPTLAGPKRPQDRVPLRQAKASFAKAMEGVPQKHVAVKKNGDQFELSNGSVVIAAITSCTNTSNPSLMLGAGLVAKKAVERGLRSKPWVKTSLAPGSKVVTDYLNAAGLTPYLEQLNFHLVGYGCTTCIGNSGPLPEAIGAAVKDNNLVAVSVLSGNRNFEGRVHPLVKANYLASPPLVVAYALAGHMDFDMASEPLGNDKNGKPVYLRDIWPTPKEVEDTVRSAVKTEQYNKEYGEVFQGDQHWRGLKVPEGDRYVWEEKSTYIKRPPFFDEMPKTPAEPQDIRGARVLALLGTQRHHRPHLPGRLDSAGRTRGQVSDRQWREARRIQFVRRAARQSRSHGARHVRQYSPAKHAGARHGRRMDAAPAQRRQDDHLRCRDALPGRKSAASGAGGQGIRLRLFARLGGQGPIAAGRARRNRRKLRAHPPQQPGGHGHPAAAISRRPNGRVAGPDRQGKLHDRRHRCAGTANENARARKGRKRARENLRGAGARGYAGRSFLLPARRNLAVRAAPDAAVATS